MTTTKAPGGATRVTVHTAAKLGRSVVENEDSVAVDATAGRFAMADGAATSARAEVWSHILVEAYVHERLGPDSATALSALRNRWLAEVSSDNHRDRLT